ncbi:MAG: DsbA family protein, partial [Desulfoplanes sp.]|nr:DsbA family protein [Desulfoplanes sp.]
MWRALPLHQEIPEEGMSLEKFIGDPHVDINGMLEKFRHTAEEYGLPFVGSPRICNTRPAQEIRAWTHEKYGQGQAFEEAAFAAYFVGGNNLDLPEVLLAIVRDLHLPKDEARKVLKTRS